MAVALAWSLFAVYLVVTFWLAWLGHRRTTSFEDFAVGGRSMGPGVAGLTLGAGLHELPATVWGVAVCDDERYFLDKTASDAADWHRRYPDNPMPTFEPRVVDGYVGEGYGIADDSIFELIAEAGASTYGFILSKSSQFVDFLFHKNLKNKSPQKYFLAIPTILQ